MFYCEILSGIWISDMDILNNINFLKDKDISIILNCTEIIDFPNLDIEKIRLPFKSSQSDITNVDRLCKNYKKIIKFIDTRVDTNNILISCYDGKSISVLIMAIYLKHYSSLNKDNIIKFLSSKSADFHLWCDLDLFSESP